MELTFHRIFNPLTALPFSRDYTYREAAAGSALSPYVRCFWGSPSVVDGQAPLYNGRLVTPDACVDLIIQVENGRLSLKFSGFDDAPFTSRMIAGPCSVFAVRFYFWAIPFLPHEAAEGVLHPSLPGEACFPGLKEYLQRAGFACADFTKRREIVEHFLLHTLTRPEAGGLFNALGYLLERRGAVSVKELAAHEALSPRTLERRFETGLGIPPKRVLEVVRYQYLWRAMLTQRDFDVQEGVEAFGFYDQAHLLNTFRRLHGLYPAEALAYSRGAL